ncbi:DEAD/DEAH box helicase [Ornithinimicrobium panacihumi]|uniref:DEAD/DEAH box helicase n=1 Tax=Ornithinimicrobium panacihumi TaxID=2008449 RepID=UPI003F8A5E13
MTAKDLSSAAWVRQVSREMLVEAVGLVTVLRAEGYVGQGRVRTLVAAPGGAMLLSTVLGSGRLYQTIVRRLGDEGGLWQGQCSCPVGVDCKHTVAVLLETQRRLAPEEVEQTAGWEVALQPLLGAAEARPRPDRATAGSTALALQLSVDHSYFSGAESTRIMVRPLRAGRAGRWIKTGATWRDLGSQWASPEVLPAHREAVTQLHTVAKGATSYYQYSSEEVSLGDLGRLAWPLLRACVAVGVELVPGRGASAVQLGEGEASLAVDVTRDDAGGLTLRPFVAEAEGPARPGSRFVIGRPGHGVAHVDDDEVLTLWPLAEAPAEAALPLLQRDLPLAVPPEDVGRFLAVFYPLIASQVRLSSLDGSVPEARQSRPGLVLEILPQEGHVLDLSWSLSFAVPGLGGGAAEADGGEGAGGGEVARPSVVLLPLGGHEVAGRQDDPAVAELFASVVADLQRMPSLIEHPPGWDGSRDTSGAGRTPRPRATITLAGHPSAVFAAEVVPVLQAREDVEVRIEGELPDYAEAGEAPVVHLETVAGEAQDWFDLHVTVTVAGQEVPFELLFAALVRNDPVLLLESGTWFSLDQPELHALRRLIEEARELDDRPSVPGEVRLSRYQAGLFQELLDLGVVDAQSGAWAESVEALLALGDSDRGTIMQPAALRAELRPYQQDGYRWLSTLWDAGLGGILADDMGLGKTLEVLAMIARAEQRGELGDGPVLVVAPTSVVGTWAAEAARFTPELGVTTISGTRRRRGVDLSTAIGAADVVITSYTLLRLEDEAYADLPWSAVVLDEAQFVKNHRSVTYQAVRRLGVRRTFAITGTPLENTLMDLWSMTSLAAPGLFPHPELFTDRYRKPIEAGDELSLARMRRRIRPFMMRRTKGEVAQDLPEKTEQVLQVALHPAHQRVYDQHLQRERQRVLGLLQDLDKNRMAIFRALTTLRQLALDPSLVDDQHAGLATSAKITTLVQHLSEIVAEGHRALVFSSFTGFLGKVREALGTAGIEHVYLDGRTRDRAARIAEFKEGGAPAFLISLKAGGFGLTLTEADYVFVLDPWWNPAAEAQAVDRTHRIGQTKPVNVYRLVSTGTVEEKVVALQEHKRHLFDTVVDSGAFRSGAITAKDIRALFDG